MKNLKLVEGEEKVLCTAAEKPKNTRNDIGVLEQRQEISGNGWRREFWRDKKQWQKRVWEVLKNLGEMWVSIMVSEEMKMHKEEENAKLCLLNDTREIALTVRLVLFCN